MSILYQSIPLYPVRYFHYHDGRSRISGIGAQISAEDAISNELEPLCRFLKSNTISNLECFYNTNTHIEQYNSGASFACANTFKKQQPRIYDQTYLPKAQGSFAAFARMFAFFMYYDNYLRYTAELYCQSKNFSASLSYSDVNKHVKEITNHALDKKVFDSIIKAGRVSNRPTINKLVISFSDMDNYTCLPKYFKYNDVTGILTSHFRSYTGGIVINFRLPQYFREEVNRILTNRNIALIKKNIFTKPTLIYDDTQEDPNKRFTWSCTIAYKVVLPKTYDSKILTIDLGIKNHAIMTTVDINGSYSNPITPGNEHKRIFLKIGTIMRKIHDTQRNIDKFQRAIKKIKKRNPTSPSIQKIRDNEITPRVEEIRRCKHKISILKKELSWLLARDVKRVCMRLKIRKVVTEDLTFTSKDQWAKGQDIRCITWACAKAGIQVITKKMYHASHTCPFCGSYLQVEYKNCRLSKCNGIPIPAHKKRDQSHPPRKSKSSKCRWKGDRDYTACLYMASMYFNRKLRYKKHFIVGTTPLRITQR